MQQYFIEEIVEQQKQIHMNEEQSHHIAHVMRMREHEQIRIVDKDANIYLASVHYEGRDVFAYLLESIVDTTKNPIRITLLQGMIKKEKWDFLLQKSAELGVDEIVPFISSRTVVKAKEERMDKKMQRYQKILQEACEQCKRSTLVQLQEPMDMKKAAAYTSDLNLIAYEDADIQSDKLSTLLKQNKEIQSVSIVIGCEGGFSKEEVSTFEALGYKRVSLGSRILRAETAAIASIHALSFFYELEGENK
ncbi:16S rRNA (uracil(1498)-N(3))-methyltransferase [Amedibacillus sp. YH-ame6]